MRDLGHEQSGPYARRLVERERVAAGIRRLPRLCRFRKVVGKKASALLSEELTPSWSHGAATMGLLPNALRTQRTAAAQLLGLNRLQSRSMAFALAPNAKYDPLFAATVPLVQEYATQIWDGRINPDQPVVQRNTFFNDSLPGTALMLESLKASDNTSTPTTWASLDWTQVLWAAVSFQRSRAARA